MEFLYIFLFFCFSFFFLSFFSFFCIILELFKVQTPVCRSR